MLRKPGPSLGSSPLFLSSRYTWPATLRCRIDHILHGPGLCSQPGNQGHAVCSLAVFFRSLLVELSLVPFVELSSANRATEVRPTESASIVGRLSVLLGAPIGEKNDQSALELPAYLSWTPEDVRRQFAQTYIRNRAGERYRPGDPIRTRISRSRSSLIAHVCLRAAASGATVDTIDTSDDHVVHAYGEIVSLSGSDLPVIS